MKITAKELIDRFEQSYPQWIAEKNDPNGLHIGSLDNVVNKVLVTLDLRPNVVQEAIEKQVDLIIVKHPPIFSSISRITIDDPQTKMYCDLIKHNINVYAAHTNIDIANDGLNDWLLEMIDCKVEDYLEEVHNLPYQQFEIYNCKDQSVKIIKKLKELNSVIIFEDNFNIKGIISPNFKQNMVQLLSREFEISNDSIIWQDLINGPSVTYGIGRVGMLSKPIKLAEFCRLVKTTYEMDHVKLISTNPDKMVQKVAICSGSGQKFYQTAKAKGADVYITGDVYYHVGHNMLESGMAVIDAGHYIEHLMIPNLAKRLVDWSKENQWDVEIIESQVNTNPFSVY